jgi:putative copper export protein
VAVYYIVLCLHILGATIWAGGHLVLALSILPSALKEKNAEIILEFEKRFEKVGLPALGTQLLTGLWLAYHILGMPNHWFSSEPIAHLVQAKLLFLTLTLALAISARLFVIPKLSNENLRVLAWHIRLVTTLAVLFVLVGASIRLGGYPAFN